MTGQIRTNTGFTLSALMVRARRTRPSALGLVLLGWLAVAPALPAQTSQTGGPLAYVLEDRPHVQKLLLQAEQAVLARKPGEAAAALADLLLLAGDDVTLLSRELHTGVRERARTLMTLLPAEAVVRARERRAAEAATRLAAGRATRNPAGLWTLVSRFTFTPAAAAALEELGDRALESGDTALAFRCYHRYLRYYRPREAYADLPWPRVLAKAGMTAAAVNDPARLEAVRKAAAGDRAARVRIGAGEQDLGGFLDGLQPVAPPMPGPDWPLFGGNPARSARPAGSDGTFAGRLAVIDPPRLQEEDMIGEADPGSRGYSCIQPPFPAVRGDRLYYFNGRQVGVYDLNTGQLRAEHVFRPTNPADRDTLPFRFRHVTVGPDNLFVVTELEPEFTNRPTQRVIHAFRRPDPAGSDAPGPAAPLMKLWSRGGAGDPDPDLARAHLTGSPLRVGDRVFVAGTVRQTDDRVYVFALDPASGRLMWKRFLSAGAGEQQKANFSRVLGGSGSSIDPLDGETMVSSRRGVVYVSTNMGVVAALTRGDGEILWLHRYARRSRPQNPSLLPAVIPRPWLDNPILIAGRRILYTPRDSDRLHVLTTEPDLERGLVQVASIPKTTVDSEYLYLIGSDGERAFLAETRWQGENQVFRITCLNLGSGPRSEEWTFEIPHIRNEKNEPVEYFTGRALLERRCVLVPTNKALYGLDARTGLRTFTLEPGVLASGQGLTRFGNVMQVGRRLLSILPDAFTVYESTPPATPDPAPGK